MICKRCSDGAQDATARQEASDPIIHPHIQTQAKKSLLTFADDLAHTKYSEHHSGLNARTLPDSCGVGCSYVGFYCVAKMQDPYCV